jgi:hypothetical protein
VLACDAGVPDSIPVPGLKKEVVWRRKGGEGRKTRVSNGSNQSVVGNSRSDKRVDVVSTLGWFGEASLGFHVADFRHSFRKNVIRNVYVCHLFENLHSKELTAFPRKNMGRPRAADAKV